jgi:hypothetical protein
MMSDYLPSGIQERVDALREVTGVEAVVTHKGNTYLLEHGSDRVHLVCKYVRNSRGRFTYSSTLSVDGKPRELVDSVQSYARLLADPDDKHPNRRPGRELPPVYPLDEGEEVPALVTMMEQVIGAQDGVVSLTIGHCSMAQRKRWAAATWPLNEDDETADPDAYVVEAVKDSGSRIQVHFQPHPAVPGLHYVSGMSGVDDRGRDLMSEYGDDIDKAMIGLLGVKIPVQSGVSRVPHKPVGDSKGAASNSVMVRKATVFRI